MPARRSITPADGFSADGTALGALGRFELLRELGRGGTGVVYEAYDREWHAVVALKTLVSTDAEGVFRLKQEFRALANLEHEGAPVRLEELSSVGGQFFFTMERVDGHDFVAYVRPADDAGETRLDEGRLRDTLGQLI